MMNWNEVIYKENKNARIFDEFNVNPANLKIMTDKPNRVIPQAGKPTAEDKQFEDTLQQSLKQFYSTPKLKYKQPVTASQEIGWDYDRQFQ
jgi:hypothetical protein